MEQDNHYPKNPSLSAGIRPENHVSGDARPYEEMNGIPVENEVPNRVDRDREDDENGKRDDGIDNDWSKIDIGDEVAENKDSENKKIAAVHRDAEEENGKSDFDSGENTSESEIGDRKADAVKPNEISAERQDSGGEKAINGDDHILRPHSQLPQPEVPPGLTKSASNGEDYLTMNRSLSENYPTVDLPLLGKFLRDKSNSLSASITKRISSLKESNGYDKKVTEIHLPGLKVIVQLKKDESLDLDFKGRISFFSRSNCRDCTAVRSFFREKRLRFVEINIDVYPVRETELIQRSEGSSVPQIFFNEKLFGGLVALNSLRNSGEFDERVREMLGKRCPDSAPSPPVYGFDDVEDERTDEMLGIVRVLRQRLPIQDRLTKMKIVKNCFSGSEMVEVIVQHLECGRKKAIEIGKVLSQKHFIHHVFRENDFEDGHHFYRFLEHEPIIPRCFNFRGSTNDSEPKPAAAVGKKLTKIMIAILEAYASADRRHVDYKRISASEEFRRYVNLIQDLHRVDVLALSGDEKLAFFLNLYNAMAIHAVIRIGGPEGVIDRRTFYGDFHYIVGGYPYSLAAIKNGILRSNRRQPYSLTKPFSSRDKRLEVSLPKVNPLIHFGLCNGTRSSPTVRFFSAEGIEAELRFATREFFLGNGIEIDLEKRTVKLTRIIKWYSIDFGQEKEILKWLLNYLDATKAGLLTHLLSDGGPINIVYQNYDWSLNS